MMINGTISGTISGMIDGMISGMISGMVCMWRYPRGIPQQRLLSQTMCNEVLWTESIIIPNASDSKIAL